MTHEESNIPPNSEKDNSIYLIFNSDAKQDVQKIPVIDIALIDVREKCRDNRILHAMLFVTIISGILVGCEVVFDILWINGAILEILGGICVLSLTSAVWYFFIKRYEVMVTFSSGKKVLLE